MSCFTHTRDGASIASLVLFVFLLGACHKAPPPAPPPPAEVQVMQVKPSDVPIFREWVGTLDGTTNATIRAQVTGYLQKIAYTEGSYIKKGQLLFVIDDRPFAAAVAQAKAQLVEAEARFKKTEIDVTRLRPLAASQAVSQQELDNAIQANAGAQGVVDAAKATLDRAQLELDFTKITAPIDGIIGLAKGQIGDLVGQSTGELTTISAIDPIRAYFSLSEQEYLAAINKARKDNDTDAGTYERLAHILQLELILGDGEVYPHKGVFKFVDRQVNLATGAIRIAGEFTNPGHILRPGMFSRIRVRTRIEKDVIVVPQRAIIELQGSHQVLVVGSDNKATVRPVKTGERVGGTWIIKEGLKPGETIVVEGIQKARAGGPLHATPFETSKN